MKDVVENGQRILYLTSEEFRDPAYRVHLRSTVYDWISVEDGEGRLRFSMTTPKTKISFGDRE